MHLQGLNQPVSWPGQNSQVLISGGGKILQYNLLYGLFFQFTFKNIPTNLNTMWHVILIKKDAKI